MLLDLLMALPEELQKLPCEALVQHMLDTYQHLTDPQPDMADVDVGVTDARTDSEPQEEASSTPSQAEKPRDSSSRWKVPGVCPLNPFLVPLELLGTVTSPAR